MGNSFSAETALPRIRDLPSPWTVGNSGVAEMAPWPWADRTRGWSTPIAELMIDDPMSFLLECRLHLWQFLKFEKLTLE